MSSVEKDPPHSLGGQMPKTLTLVGCALVTGYLMAAPLDGQGKASPAEIALKMERAVSGVTRVKSLTLEGGIRVGVDTSTGQVTPERAPFEMRVLLPTHYLRVYESLFRGASAALHQDGFRGPAPLYASTPLQPGTTSSSSPVGDAYVSAQRAAAARLWLGVTGMLDGPLTLNAELGGRASTLHVTGPDNFDCHVDVAADTGTPLQVRYEGSSFFYTPPTEGQRRADQWVDKAEFTLSFADRRPTGGVLVPYLITLTARSLRTDQSYMTEEVRVERARVNPPLTEADFKVLTVAEFKVK
jgi:hypothetical protein